jgi:hypothetical protein
MKDWKSIKCRGRNLSLRAMPEKLKEFSPAEMQQFALETMGALYMGLLQTMVDRFGEEETLTMIGPQIKHLAVLGAEINLERHGLDRNDPWTAISILNFVSKTNGIKMKLVEETSDTAIYEVRDCPMKGYLPGCDVWVLAFEEVVRYLQPEMRLSYDCRLSEGADRCLYTFHKRGGLAKK